jgi:Xaa-Pro aminopeptidase
VSCRDTVREGDLVLFDAGAEMGHFAADVTRTIPASGRFSKHQEALYHIVLAAHQAAVETVAPGATLDEVHGAAARVITQGLLDQGLLKGRLETLMARQAYKRWFPHGTSHWLGLDVHDTGDYALDVAPRRLEEGMVVTVEPGLYLPADDRKVPEKWRGTGIRIEDDVLVTTSGRRLLTEDIPRTPREIEAAMQTRSRYLKALPQPKTPAAPVAAAPAARRRQGSVGK